MTGALLVSSNVVSTHFDELANGSGIQPGVVGLNFKSLEAEIPYEYLCFSKDLSRTNTGRLEKWVIDLLAHTEKGGWWCSGLDPLNDWKPMEWGCFKPNEPRLEKQQGFNPNFVPKAIKYEHPLKTQTRAFFLRVPLSISFGVALNYGKTNQDTLIAWVDRLRDSLDEILAHQGESQANPSTRFSSFLWANHAQDLEALYEACRTQEHTEIERILQESPLSTLEDTDFWPWIHASNLSIIIEEGAKKAAATLSNGYAAIALPGISMGYRVLQSVKLGKRRELIPELQHFATLGREVLFCFDYETKPKTIHAVSVNVSITSDLLSTAGCKVKVVRLPGPEKGVDDFLVAQGAEAFERCIDEAVTLDEWHTRQLFDLTVPPTLTVNRRYLGDIPIPETGLALVKSPKDTGKTTALEKRIGDAVRDGRRVLVISHRIQLCRAICTKLGINYVEEIWGSETGQILGYGLCIDSLHPTSQARFNADDWRGAIVILDEVEQVFWHVLNSTTCINNRVSILETLKELVHTVITSEGLIIAQDADLSDLSVDYLRAMAVIDLEPWLLVNEYKPENAWNIDYYMTPDPSAVVGKMITEIESGKRVFLSLDAQKAKSRYGSINLESYFAKKFPEHKVLRIDSETVCDPESPAFGIIEHLNEDIINYDIVIATPSLGTGVSIDVRGHFGAVFGIYQGTIPDSEVRQALARVREPVPRYVWAKAFSASKISNGSTYYRDLLKSTREYVSRTVQMLKDVDFDVDAASDPISIRTWAKMAARVNISLKSYRDAIRQGFEDEGHTVNLIDFDPNPDGSKRIKDDVTGERESNQQAEAEAVANAPDINDVEAARLDEKRAKTAAERLMHQKHNLKARYGVDVTPELKRKDDDGWFRKIQLHYFLTHDIEQVIERDKKHLEGHLERGNGKVCLQDLRLFTSKVKAFEIFKIESFMNPDRLLRRTDADLIEFAQNAQRYRKHIKNIIGFHVPEEANPIQVLGMFLDRLGLKLELVKREQNPDGSRTRVYSFVTPKDGRDEIFKVWEQRDAEARPHPAIYDQITDGLGFEAA